MISSISYPKISILKASKQDIDAIVSITRQKGNRKALPWVMKVTLNDAIENPQKNILLIAKDNFGKVLGFIREYCRMDKTATIHEIAVEDTNKSQGIGSRLIAEALNIAKANGIKSVQLKTPSDLTRTHNFYEKLGFINTGELKTPNRLLYIFKKDI